MSLTQFIHAKLNPPKDTKPSFKGQSVIVTGANTGIGYEAALKFVQLGAERVVLGVRTISKGEAARTQLEQKAGRKNVIDVWQLDMLDYASVKAFADRASKELEHLDVAVLNAGAIFTTFQKSTYGWEKTLQVDTLSTTLLALLLMPKLKASKTAEHTPRLQLVGSSIIFSVKELKADQESQGKSGPLEYYNLEHGLSPLQFSFDQYGVSKLLLAYAQEGLANLATSQETGKPDVIVSSVCPGPTQSEIGRDATGWLMRIAVWILRLLQRTTEQGSRSYISGVSLDEKVHGRMWNNDVIRERAPLQIGEKGQALQAQAWQEIIGALEKDNPEVVKLSSL